VRQEIVTLDLYFPISQLRINASAFLRNLEVVRNFAKKKILLLLSNIECDPLNATNASKYLIDQLEERILLIDQSKNASKHL